MLTQKRLKEVLDYNLETGFFVWKVTRSHNAKKGSKTGYRNESKKGYIEISIDNKLYYGHRLAWLYVNGEFPQNDIDHIDGCRYNNSYKNLRAVTRSENNQNIAKAKKSNKLGILGVSFSRTSNLFVAQIQVNGKYKNLGYFKTALEAHNSYLKAKKELHPMSSRIDFG